MDKMGYFDEIAPAWDREHREAGETESLASLTAHFSLSRNDAVLDAGCGTGRLAPFIRNVIGGNGLLVELDYSADMLAIGKRTIRSAGPVFVRSNVERIPFKDALFDRVICFSLFPHVDDKAAALGEFHRILKPGRLLFIAHLMGRKQLNAFHARLRAPVSADRILEGGAMTGLLRAAGFKEISIKDEPGLYLTRAMA